MDFEQISRSLLPLLGGKENIASAAHCATRLRLVLVDDALADQQAIGKIEGVKGCFRNAGQMQIIFGTGVVNKVYAAFIQAAGISESSKSEAADIAAKKLNPFQRIARLLSNIFVPIIPAIVASGLLMGLLGMVKTYGWVDPSNALYIMLDMCSSAAFIILPILIGFTAAREFGGNPYLGATLGGILTHPALTNAWGVASGFHTMNFFGLPALCLGDINRVGPDTQVIVEEDSRVYRKALVENGRLKAILLLGDISASGIFQYLIKNEVPLPCCDRDIFRLTFADFYGFDKESGKYLWNAG